MTSPVLAEGTHSSQPTRSRDLFTMQVPSFKHLYDSFGYEPGMQHVYQCIYNLLYLGVGYRLAAFVALLFTNKDKQRAA